MNITARILESEIIPACKNKDVTFGVNGLKIGKIINSRIEKNSLVVEIKINKAASKRIEKLLESGKHGSYEINYEDDKFIFEPIKIKQSKIEKKE